MATYTGKPQQDSQAISNSKTVDDILKDISEAVKYSKESFDEYNENLSLVYVDSLTDEDKAMLNSEDRSTLTFPVIASIVAQQIKNIRDSIPDASVNPLADDSDDKDANDALALTDRLHSVYQANRYKDRMIDTATKAGTGGMGVLKLSTEYINNISFEQKIVVRSVPDPTTVLFDPAAKEDSKQDANHVVEIVPFDEESFKHTFPNANLERIEQDIKDGNAGGVDWIREDGAGRKIIKVAAYYFKEYKSVKKYLVKKAGSQPQFDPNEQMQTEGQYPNAQPQYTQSSNESDTEITDEKPKNTDLILDERVINEVCIKRVEICGRLILSPAEELNFKHLPFSFLASDMKIIKGKQKLIPFAKAAMDAQRAKDISFNYLFFEMVNGSAGRFMISEESSTKEADDAILNPSMKKVIRYRGFQDVDGQMVPLPPPTYLPPSPLPADHIGVFNQMDETINKILGAQYQSLSEGNLSGAAMYNLADFMSASTATLMTNMITCASHVAEIILHALPMLYDKQVAKIDMNGKKEQPYIIDYNEMEIERFGITIDRGVNYALQQEATVDRLLKFAQVSPSMAQWLDKAGIPILLQNSNLNDKQKVISSYENFVEQAMEQQQQSPPPPNPEFIKAQAASMNAQAAMQRAQNDTQRTQIQSAQTEQDMHSNNIDQMLNMKQATNQEQRDRQEFISNMYKQDSENKREMMRYHLQQAQRYQQ
jgi:hypothetical protein